MSFLDWSTNGYRSRFARNELEYLADLGASHLGLIVTEYQNSVEENEMRPTSRTVTVQSLRAVLEAIDGEGMKSIIKPHVDLENDGSRTQISPTDIDLWFQNYRDFILPLVDIAEEFSATHFVIGTELSQISQYESRWISLITEIRSRYSGLLVYAANWDEVFEVPFWASLDLVGVDFYYPLSDQESPSRLNLLESWELWTNRLDQVHQQTGKRILLTEIGYRSIEGAGMRPYDFSQQGVISQEDQADLYWAAIESTNDLDWIEGLLWWGWPAFRENSDSASRGYTPRGKSAEEILRQSWQ